MNNAKRIINKVFQMPIFWTVFFYSIIFTNCNDFFAPPEINESINEQIEAGYGWISISFSEEGTASQQARTVLPVMNFDKYEYTFTKAGDSTGITKTPDTNGFFILEIGNYTVEVKAFIRNGESYTPVASGVSSPFSVGSGSNDPVIVLLNEIDTDGEGKFRYTITFPLGATAEINLQKWSNNEDIPLSPIALTNEENGITEILDLESGYYLLTVLINKNHLRAGISEIIHIYNSLSTVYEKDFDDNDLLLFHYTVTFDINGAEGGSIPNSQTISAGSGITLPNGGGLFKKYSSFGGWNTEADGTGINYNVGSPYTVTDNITLYARWYPIYTVTFDINNGDTEANPQTKTVTYPATTIDRLPEPPTRTGHVFAGWKMQENGLGTTFTASTTITGNITVYAFWLAPFTSITDAANYLNSTTGGLNVNDPIILYMDIDLGIGSYMVDSGSNWRSLLNIIQSSGKFVALDLSICTITGYFTLNTSITTGKSRIVTLVLPNSAWGISGGSSDVSSFNHFNNLNTVSGKISSISSYAFNGCTSLTNISFPDATSIDNRAFSGCTGLTSVSFPKVTTISNSAFRNCTNLTSVFAPLVTNIGGDAFYGCSNLESIDFPLLETIEGYSAFGYCTSLVNVSLPSATHIGYTAFLRCTNLVSASFPEATSIGTLAFDGCNSLTSISFPASAIIYDYPFRGCTSLTNFDLIGTGYLNVIEDRKALVRNATELVAYPSASGSININTITSIGKGAFVHTNLTSVFFPDVITIGQDAFASCFYLTSASFPKITNIGMSAFSDCNRLSSISLPVVTSIEFSAFYNCNTITSISISAGLKDSTFNSNQPTRMNNFKNYYFGASSNANGNRGAGTYTWNGSAWTGPSSGINTYTAIANGNASTPTTQITLTFNTEPTGLTIADITLGGNISKGNATLSGSGTTRIISGFTVNNSGNATITINRSGIETGQKTMQVYFVSSNNPITYTVTANGNSSTITTQITLTFNANPTSLTIDNISLGGSISGNASLSGSGTTRTISGFTVNSTGNATISISASGIETGQKTVQVYFSVPATPELLDMITFLRINPVIGATVYYVYRSTSYSGPFTLIETMPQGYNTISNFAPPYNTTYYYRVSAYNNAGESAPSTILSIMSPPPEVTNLSVTTTTRNSINLTWTAPSGAVGYRIWQGSTFIEIVSGTSYTFTGLLPDSSYRLGVQTLNSGNNLSNTEYVSGRTNP